MVNKPIVFSRMVKQYQFDVFYERELKLWEENPIYDGIPLRVWLYHNRLQYTGKNPAQLTAAELMRGFTISGILRGYTVFDTSLMHEAVQKYDIHSVYDPCAGWGERMLYCYYNDMAYLGVDINRKLEPGYRQMQRDFNMMKQDIVFADSAVYTPKCHVDAVITCPPYGNTEHYSDAGAENLSDKAFLDWWQMVVRQCMAAEPKYFCFQINRKWYQSMVDVVQFFGFALIDEFLYHHHRSSHLTRKNGRDCKKEYESMVVFAR